MRNYKLIPIVFGVTGHRDIRNEDKVKLVVAIKEYFKKFAKKYPETPLILLSPLAEGADRLAARSFLELNTEPEFEKDKERFKLIVPLPMSLKEYMCDFREESSIKEFNELINMAEYYVELPKVKSENCFTLKDPEGRKKQYAQLGAYIVQNSQVLLALWDGVENELEGGTACIVRYHRNGVPEEYKRKHNPFNSVETGPVYHILTPRESSKTIPENLFMEKYKYPDFWKKIYTDKSVDQVEIEANKFYDNIFNRFNQLNKDINNNHSLLKESSISSKKDLINPDNYDNVNADLENIADYYSVFDVLATKYSDKRVFVLRVNLILIVFAVLCFQVFLEFLNHPLVLLLYPLSLIVGIILYFNAKSKEFDKKHEDYRSMAEAIRIHFHWSFNDINESINDYLLSKHKGELEWIRQCISNILLITNKLNSDTDTVLPFKMDVKRWTLEHWINNQITYFKEKSKYNDAKEKTYKKLSIFSYALGFISVLILLSLKIFYSPNDTLFNIPEIIFYHIFVVLIGFSLAILGTTKNYVEKMSFLELSQQYSIMMGIYQRAAIEIEKNIEINNHEIIINTLINLGKEALNENTDWLLLHRSHNLELPSA